MKKINYKEFVLSAQINYTILSFDDEFVVIDCNKCHAIRTLKIKSLYRNIVNNKNIHNQFCSKYYLNVLRDGIGIKEANHFYDFYRSSKERCNNPNNKDYIKYRNKFKFNDFVDFYDKCKKSYIIGIEEYGYKNLTIDRIDGEKFYEDGNIRFVDMKTNLQNKKNVKPVKMTNINTSVAIKGKSFGDLSVNYGGNTSYASALYRSCKKNTLYKKEWTVEYE